MHDVTGDYALGAANIVGEADTKITFKVGGNEVVIDSSGVTIKGSMITLDSSTVKIASGSGTAGGSMAVVEANELKEPEKPVEAASIDPGEDSKVKAKKKELESTKLDSSKISPQEPDDNSEPKTEVSWVAFNLKDDAGKPVPDEPYKVKTSDGKIYTGTLDDQGKARIDGIPKGNCEITFPRMHKTEWKHA